MCVLHFQVLAFVWTLVPFFFFFFSLVPLSSDFPLFIYLLDPHISILHRTSKHELHASKHETSKAQNDKLAKFNGDNIISCNRQDV